ncbi:hypothetical protein DACRYDRAFT_117671 [Dacryopinax primogenitus]|uniref:Exocyst complex component Sec8 n=1 Tax=Dacryopinax primogenitus (strain DJM 731) TaxID=1858805 RepID=M5FV02_DACPD|nr:uncharacterized protein DACRYDRAFT_117671 [Dacryopinax primogenitus]EJU00084.1 hypothetical protein DACRYDRAFT_117671 [Dacryopinax primogenitus]
MSRQGPFPTQRSRQPPDQSYNYGGGGSLSTPPLNVSRNVRDVQQSGRGASPLPASSSAPMRPARSNLRERLNSSDSVPSANQWRPAHQPSDSYASARFAPSDEEQGLIYDEPQPQPEAETPKALGAVIAAFQNAGETRRKMTNGSAGSEVNGRSKRREGIDRSRTQDRERRTNGKGPTNELDAMLDKIKDKWGVLADEDFNPVEVALSLLDNSSVGRDIDSFRRTKLALERALKATVDKHYQSFAASLPHHAALLTSLSSTQDQIQDAKTRLTEVREALGSKRADLVQLWSRNQALDEMMKLLDEIDRLKSIPDQLESLMTEKRILQAAVLLVKNLKTINKPDMLEVGAVADLRSYLSSQETALRDILIEELHNHLYLKSFWCESRWSAYTPGQESLPIQEAPQTSSQPQAIPNAQTPSTPVRPPTKLARFLTDLAVRPTIDPLLDIIPSPLYSSPLMTAFTSSGNFPDDVQSGPAPSKNPESDSFMYMETVLESLAVLGQLGYSLDVVAQRLPAEIHLLIETTIDEVTERQESQRRQSTFTPSSRLSLSNVSSPLSNVVIKVTNLGRLRSPELEGMEKETEREVLRDLFWTLYSKLDAVLQGLRVVFEVTGRISSRREFKDSSGARPGTLFPLGELYQPLLSEVQMLLRDQLTDEDRAASVVNPIASISEALQGRTSRDRTKHSFRFTESDVKLSVRVLKKHEEELNRVLKDNVPGLVQSNADSVTALSRAAKDDRFAATEKHRLLIRPSAFHVSVLFHPTQAFLHRIGEILPSSVYDSFKDDNALLDDFVLHVYLPQLEDKVSNLVHSAISGPDAFEEDPTSLRISPKPLVKACTQLMAVINSLCAMLQSTNFHRENYSRLILSVVIHFYQRFNMRFQALVARNSIGLVPDVVPDAMLHISARWAQKPEVSACLSELYATPDTDTIKKQTVCQQETRIELSFLNNEEITRDHLIPLRNLAELCRLHYSLTWFIHQLSTLRVLAEDPISPQSAADPLSKFFSPAKPTFKPKQGLSGQHSIENENLSLPLTKAMALRFDALLKTYDLLAEVILFSTRIDIRCRTIHYLNLAIRTNDFLIDQAPLEPDVQVVELNADMGKIDDFAASTLPERERRFLFEGLGSLMDQLLVSGGRYINLMNSHGLERVLRNLLALEQNLKTMTGDEARDADLSRARRYWAMFAGGPKEMLERAKVGPPQFSFDEYRAMLTLQCGVEQLKENPGSAGQPEQDSARSSMTENADRRAYNEFLIDLHALAIEDW